MDSFHSTYTNKIDKKGRVSVPAQFRAVLAKQGSAQLILFPSLHFAAIEGAGEDYLKKINQEIESLPPFSQERDDLIDAILPNTRPLTFDGEGRVVLPEDLIAHAGLDGSASFVGRGPTFQIWQPEALRRRQDEALARVRARRGGGGA